MKFSRKGLVCVSVCGLVAGLLVAWLLTGCTIDEQSALQEHTNRMTMAYMEQHTMKVVLK